MNSQRTALKDMVPFPVKHRLRRTVNAFVSFPRDQASCAIKSPGRLQRQYQAWYWRRHLQRFFEQLVRPGDLVFDIGAHVGLWTLGLERVGCRVIAVEPQGACADKIASRSGERVTIVHSAVGSAAGEAELFLSANTEMASLAPGWMKTMIERAGVPAEAWSESVIVPVRTLDDLVDEFGVPEYIKLDVEGSEAQALSGLGQPVNVISFEAHGQTVDYSSAVVGRLLELDRYEFNLSPGEFPKLLWPDWRDERRLLRALKDEPTGWHNVFARRADSPARA